MFNELDAVTLTTAVPIADIEDIDPDSPLHNTAQYGPGLQPGDCGTIVAVLGGGAYLVEFLNRITSHTIAMAVVKPEQIRLSTDEDHRRYRFADPTVEWQITLDDGTVATYKPETESFHIVNQQGQRLHNPNPFEPYDSNNWLPVAD